MKYIIWHDNDYDFAMWVYENSVLSEKEEVLLKSIPKTNDGGLIIRKFKEDTDYDILPIIKLATPDIIVQKVDGDGSQIVFASEFMTHTPQHDHVFQRFERIYNISKEKIPVAFVLPLCKTKLEKGKREGYKIVKYSPNPLAVHTYLKSTTINQNATLMFFWPDNDGYLKYDSKHQTAPMIEDNILEWFSFLNESINNEDYSETLKSDVVKKQIKLLETSFLFKTGGEFSSVDHETFISNFKNYYNLERIRIISTPDAIKEYNLDKGELSEDFLDNERSLIFEYDSREFRTDPYAGFTCGFTNLFCIDGANNKIINFIHVPRGIKFSDVSSIAAEKSRGFSETNDPSEGCPLYSQSNLKKTELKGVRAHLPDCKYTKSKQQRIFGTVPDLIVFKDKIHYNKDD